MESSDMKIILAVDDTALNLQIITATLQGKYDVRAAKNTDAAMRFLLENTVELILLDIEMPDMNGFEFLRIIRKIPAYRDVPVIFVTAYSTQEFFARAVEEGVHSFISKPIIPTLLMEKVASALNTEAKGGAEGPARGRDITSKLASLKNACAALDLDSANQIVSELVAMPTDGETSVKLLDLSIALMEPMGTCMRNAAKIIEAVFAVNNDRKIILAIDDITLHLQVISSALKDTYDIRTAKDSDKAFRFLAGNRVDLILLDIEMPDMNGFELMGKIRKIPAYKNIPVIFVSANSADNYVKMAMELGAKGFVPKPIKISLLREKIESALGLDEFAAYSGMAATMDSEIRAKLISMKNACESRNFAVAGIIAADLQSKLDDETDPRLLRLCGLILRPNETCMKNAISIIESMIK